MSNRYEKEIEEILKKAGASPPAQNQTESGENPPERQPRRRRSLLSAGPGKAVSGVYVSYKYLLLAAVGVLVASIFFGGLPLFLVGAGLLVAGYVMYYRAPRRRFSVSGGESERQTKMWRGRVIDSGDGDDPHFTQDRWGRRR